MGEAIEVYYFHVIPRNVKEYFFNKKNLTSKEYWIVWFLGVNWSRDVELMVRRHACIFVFLLVLLVIMYISQIVS